MGEKNIVREEYEKPQLHELKFRWSQELPDHSYSTAAQGRPRSSITCNLALKSPSLIWCCRVARFPLLTGGGWEGRAPRSKLGNSWRFGD